MRPDTAIPVTSAQFLAKKRVLAGLALQWPQNHEIFSCMIASARALRQFVYPAALVCLASILNGCAHLKPQPFTFVQLCDPQIGFGGYEADLARFRQAVERINALRPDFVVVCGDLVTTPDAKSFHDFNSVRKKLGMPCYCTPGNHDLGNEPTRESLLNDRKFVGKDYLSFTHKGCGFVVLNTQIWKTPVAGETQKQDAWMQETLQAMAAKGHPVFIVEHYPPFVKTPDEPDAYFNLPIEKRKALLAAFEGYGVVAVLAGHTHTTNTTQFGRFQVVNSETTSKNFDRRPFGIRLWHVSPDGTCHHEFIPLEGP
jgi:serine/threonine-protein phosphatase CPPED1